MLNWDPIVSKEMELYQLHGADRSGDAASELRIDARRNQKRILLAGARVLATDPHASMQRIADEAEVGRPTVYRRYPTRDALVEAIAQDAITEFTAALDEAETDGGDAASALESLIRALTRIGADYPVIFESQTAHNAKPVVDRVEQLIVRGQAEGAVRADVTPEVLRYALFGALSACLRVARDPSTGASRRGTNEIAAQLAAIIVDGVRPRLI
jgi:AcrR family transcriptional regulator